MSANKNGFLKPDKISIVNTKFIKCNIDCPFSFSIEDVVGHDYNIGFNLSFNIEDSLVKADFELKLSTKSKEEIEEEATGNFHFVYIYSVENLNELVISDDNNELIINGSLGNAMASITYSTSRGILFARLKGTGLESFILPVIDPNSLLEIDK